MKNFFRELKLFLQKVDQEKLDNESKRLAEYYYKRFLHYGANLSPEEKTNLKKLNEEEATLSAKFKNKLLTGTKAADLIVSDKAELDGLTSAELNAAKQSADSKNLSGKWIIAGVIMLTNYVRKDSTWMIHR